MNGSACPNFAHNPSLTQLLMYGLIIIMSYTAFGYAANRACGGLYWYLRVCEAMYRYVQVCEGK